MELRQATKLITANGGNIVSRSKDELVFTKAGSKTLNILNLRGEQLKEGKKDYVKVSAERLVKFLSGKKTKKAKATANDSNFAEELEAINGVGAASAKALAEEYGTKKKLVAALVAGKVEVNNRVLSALKATYL